MSNTPNPARRRAKPKPKPFDLDALSVEAHGTPFQFTFGGETYEIAPVLDMRVAEMLQDNNWSGAVRLLLGPEQWDRINASDAVLDLTRTVALIEGFSQHLGTTSGE